MAVSQSGSMLTCMFRIIDVSKSTQCYLEHPTDSENSNQESSTQHAVHSFYFSAWQRSTSCNYCVQRFVTAISMVSPRTFVYRSDLSSRDFHIFELFKEVFSGTSFSNYKKVWTAVEEWLQSHPRSFFSQVFHELGNRGDACFNVRDNYV